MKLGKYTVPTGNRTPGRRVAVHYATAAPRKLHTFPFLKTLLEAFKFVYILNIILLIKL